MSAFFLKVVNMSISAGWIVLVILFIRLLFWKAPKWIRVLLWGIVAVRLVCPFTLESVMSLIPSIETISPEIMMDRTPTIHSGVSFLNNAINPVISSSFAPDLGASANPLQIWIPIFAMIWLVGVAGMLLYTVISYFRLKHKIGTAVLWKDNVFQSESVVSPFVLGMIKPKIYLPFHVNEQDMVHVIAHEQAHIHRKDHLWKPLGFLILSVHWFNPFVWLGYVLLCRDIELACDEKVIKELNSEQKADYSNALLSCSVNRRLIAACPLAFGEVRVKDRVQSVLRYKKPAFWLVAAAIAVSIIVAVCFLTDPKTTVEDELSVFLDTKIAEHHYSEGYTEDNFVAVHYKVLGVDKSVKETTVYMWVLYQEYSCENGKIESEAGAHIPTVVTAKQTGSHGHYELVEYWEPRDGSYYVKDIKKKFPWYLHGRAIDSQRYIDEQIEFCENAAKEYYSLSNVGGADGPQSVTVAVDLEKTKAKFPNFFELSTEKGLEVYIWQMAKGSYSCGLLPGKNLNYTQEELWNLHKTSATMDEMRAIISDYLAKGKVTKKDVVIQAIGMPHSSYAYEIDESYRKNLNALFWQGVVDDGEKTAESDDDTGMPTLMVTCQGKEIRTLKGTSSWTFKDRWGTMQTIQADGEHPLNRLGDLMPMALVVERPEQDSLVAKLNFDTKPDTVRVNCWFFAENGHTKPFDAEVSGLELQLNSKREPCLYEVIATWNESSTGYGTIRYSFCVVDSTEVAE